MSLLRRNKPSHIRSDAHVWRSPETKRRVRPKEHPKTRRRRKFVILAIFSVLLVGGSIGAIQWTLRHEATRFSGADVRGTFALPKPLVQNLANAALAEAAGRWFPRDNALLFDSETLALQLEDTYPRIAHADVHASSLIHPRLVVNVQERSPHALWCSEDGTCFLMDARGIIFAADTGETRATGVFFYGGAIATSTAIGSRYAPETFDSIKRFVALLQKRGMEAQSAMLRSNGDVEYALPLFHVFASAHTDPTELFSTLDIVLSSKGLRDTQRDLEYIDMRFGNRVYFKLKGQEPASVSE